MGPRRRARTYSFSGSERSHTATPTPSEVEGAMTEDESQTATEPANDLSHTEVFIVDLFCIVYLDILLIIFCYSDCLIQKEAHGNFD